MTETREIQSFCQSWWKICLFLAARGHAPFNFTPPGKLVSERLQADGRNWVFELNPQTETVDGVESFDIRVSCNGWPAALIGREGGVCAAGSFINEEALLTDLAALGEEE